MAYSEKLILKVCLILNPYRLILKRLICCALVVAFTLTTVLPPSFAQELSLTNKISPTSRFEARGSRAGAIAVMAKAAVWMFTFAAFTLVPSVAYASGVGDVVNYAKEHWIITSVVGLIVAIIIIGAWQEKAVKKSFVRMLKALNEANTKEGVLSHLSAIEKLVKENDSTFSREGKGLTPDTMKSILKEAQKKETTKQQILKMFQAIEFGDNEAGIKRIIDAVSYQAKTFTPAQLENDPLLPITTSERERAGILDPRFFITVGVLVPSLFILLLTWCYLRIEDIRHGITILPGVTEIIIFIKTHPTFYTTAGILIFGFCIGVLLKGTIKLEKVISINGIPFSFGQTYLEHESLAARVKDVVTDRSYLYGPAGKPEDIPSLIEEYTKLYARFNSHDTEDPENTKRRAAIMSELLEKSYRQRFLRNKIGASTLSAIKNNLNTEHPDVQLHMGILLAQLLGQIQVQPKALDPSVPFLILPSGFIDDNLIQHPTFEMLKSKDAKIQRRAAILVLSMMLFEEDKVVKKVSPIINKPELTSHALKKALIKRAVELIKDSSEFREIRNTAALALGLTAEGGNVSYNIFGKNAVEALKALEQDNAAKKHPNANVYFAIHRIALLYVKHLQESYVAQPSPQRTLVEVAAPATFETKPLGVPVMVPAGKPALPVSENTADTARRSG